MSSDYTILFKSKKPISIVKTQLEKLINSPLKLSEKWKHGDLYYTELLGLWLQLEDCREEPEFSDGEFSQYTYEIVVGSLGELIPPRYGKPLVQTVIVELARMITRNMKCNSVVMRDDVITHRFAVE